MPFATRASQLPLVAVTSLMASAWPTPTLAQQQPQGFAVERFYPSAPGSAWLVMDDLSMHGSLGGGVALTTSYARRPFEPTSPDGAQRLSIVSDEAFVELGLAVTYSRYRAYVSLPMPLVVTGNGGTLGSYLFNAPSVNLGANPDTIFDPRVGVEARVLGEPAGRFRLGLAAELIVPSGSRSDYLTDGTYRGMFRGLVAGDVGRFSYAGQLGAHVRPLDDAPAPGSPTGSELLFGAAVGRRISVAANHDVVIGPEFFGETAFRSFFSAATGFEGLFTARFEGNGEGSHVRVKLGAGAGLHQHFGAPHWRVVAGVEVFGQR